MVVFVCVGFGVIMVMVVSSRQACCAAVAVVQFTSNQVLFLLLFSHLKTPVNKKKMPLSIKK